MVDQNLGGAASNSAAGHERSADDAQAAMDVSDTKGSSDRDPETSDTLRPINQQMPPSNSHDRLPESDPGVVTPILQTDQPILPPSSPIDVDNLEDEEDFSATGDGDVDGTADDGADGGDVDENNLANNTVDDEYIYSTSDRPESEQQDLQKGDDDVHDSDVIDDDVEGGEGGEEGDVGPGEPVAMSMEVTAVAEAESNVKRETLEDDDGVTDEDADANANMSSEGNLAVIEVEEVVLSVQKTDASPNEAPLHRSGGSEDGDVESAEENNEMEDVESDIDDLADEVGNFIEDGNSPGPDSPDSSLQPEDLKASQVDAVVCEAPSSHPDEGENSEAKDDIVSMDDGENDSVEDDDSDGVAGASDGASNESPADAEAVAKVDEGAVSASAAKEVDDHSASFPDTSAATVPATENTSDHIKEGSSSAVTQKIPRNESQLTDSSVSERERTVQDKSVFVQLATEILEESEQRPVTSNATPSLQAVEKSPNPSLSETPVLKEFDSKGVEAADVVPPENTKLADMGESAVTQPLTSQEDKTQSVFNPPTEASSTKLVSNPIPRPPQSADPSTSTDSDPVPPISSDHTSVSKTVLQNSNPAGTASLSENVKGDVKLQSSGLNVRDNVGLAIGSKSDGMTSVEISNNADQIQSDDTNATSVARESLPLRSTTISGSREDSVKIEKSGDVGDGDVEMRPSTDGGIISPSSSVAQTDNATDERKLQFVTSGLLADNQQSLQVDHTTDIKQELESSSFTLSDNHDNNTAPSTSEVKQSVAQEDEVESEQNTDMDRSDDMKEDQNAGMTAPMFGINPVQEPVEEKRPVSFSTPPTFHSLNLNPLPDSKVPSVLRHPESRNDDDKVEHASDKQDGSGSSGAVKKHVTFAETIQEFPISPVKNPERAVLVPPTQVSFSLFAGKSNSGNESSSDKNVEDAPMSPLNDEDGAGMDSDGGTRRPSNQLSKSGSLAPVLGKEPLQVITDKQTSDGQRSVEVTNVHISVKNLSSSKRLKCPVSTIRFTLKEGDGATIEFIDTDSGTTGIWETLSPLVNYKGVKKVRKPEYAMVIVVGSVGVDETKRYYLRCQEGSYETIFRLLHDLTPISNPPSHLSHTTGASNVAKSSNDASSVQAGDPVPATRVESGGPQPSSSGSEVRNLAGPKPDSARQGAGLKRQASYLNDDEDGSKVDKKARVDLGSKSREEKKRASAAVLMNKRKELLAQLNTKDTSVPTGGRDLGGVKTAASPSASQLRRSSGLIASRPPKSLAVEATKNLDRREESIRALHGKRETGKGTGMYPRSSIGLGASGRRGDTGRLVRQSTGGRTARQNTRTGARSSAGPSSLQVQKSIFKAMKMRPPPPNDETEILSESKGAEQEAMLSEDVKKLEKSLEEKRKANEGQLMKEVSREVARALEEDRNRQRTNHLTTFRLALSKALAPWKKQKALEDERKSLQAGCVLKAHPDSPEDFFARLHTFRPVTWPEFDVQSPIGPVECALRGWHNDGVGRLVSTEGSKITVDFCDLYDSKTRAAKLRSLRGAIEGSGHALLSTWIGRKCPESFRTVDGSKRGINAEELHKIVEELRTKNVEDLVRCGRTSDNDAWTIPGLHGDGCLKLACCNWRLDGVELVDLWCNWCNRRFPVSPKSVFTAGEGSVGSTSFHPQRSHFNFCPFSSSTGSANHVRALNVAEPGLASGIPDAINGDR